MKNSDKKSAPKHIGLILDGNRRWARKRLLPTLEGHRVGFSKLKSIADYAFDNGVEYLSAFIFSTENWNREAEEVDYLMDLAITVFKTDLKKFHNKGIRIRWFGVPDRLSQKVLDAVLESEQVTKYNTRGQLCICFNYGGKLEIVEAVKKLVANGASADSITEQSIADNLMHPDVPDIDLMIRTSGEQRISNFMLWRVAYAELLFVKKHFPAFTKKDLSDAIDDYCGRERRFGGNTN
jgi:undecaprenyl diphosphate synthase